MRSPQNTDAPPTRPPVDDAIGTSEAFLAFQERLSRAARVDRPVLLVGERGTGKELAAYRVHFLSKRWNEAFVALNCSALSPALIESELFGHERGAFTGAVQQRSGRFEAADGGTLFLDEIGNIPIETQEKILRVVEYGGFERVGSSQAIRVDVRIIGATNSDLVALADEGRFMRDLLDRLSFEVLVLPPLRERREDIFLLASHFAARMASELGWKEAPAFTEEAVAALEAHAWPGNIRELKNVIERAVYRSDDALITAEEVIIDPFQSPYRIAAGASVEPRADLTSPEALPAGKTLAEAIVELETSFLRRALAQAKYNQHKAAAIMGLTYHQFRGVYRKYQKEFQVSEDDSAPGLPAGAGGVLSTSSMPSTSSTALADSAEPDTDTEEPPNDIPKEKRGKGLDLASD